MLYPDPRQRKVFGCTIRWVAGLFAALMVVTSSVPLSSRSTDAALENPNFEKAVLAEDGSSSGPERAGESRDVSGADAESNGAEPDQLASAEVAAPFLAYLASTTLAEVEIVEEPTQPDSPAILPSFRSLHDIRLAAEIAERAPTSIDAAGRRCTRAPPIA